MDPAVELARKADLNYLVFECFASVIEGVKVVDRDPCPETSDEALLPPDQTASVVSRS